MQISKEVTIRTIYALCLLGAGLNHLQTILRHGLFWDYHHAPVISQIFWTSLTFLDLIAAILLFIKPRIGLVMTFLIILIDVIHNTWIGQKQGYSLLNYMYLSQLFFLIFVIFSIHYPWQKLPKP